MGSPPAWSPGKGMGSQSGATVPGQGLLAGRVVQGHCDRKMLALALTLAASFLIEVTPTPSLGTGGLLRPHFNELLVSCAGLGWGLFVGRGGCCSGTLLDSQPFTALRVPCCLEG